VHESDENRIVLLQEVVFDPEEIGKMQVHEIVHSIRTAVAAHHGIQVSEIALMRNNSLLKTSSGKIQRHACRNAYLSGALDPLFSTLHSPAGLTSQNRPR
jgi:acyl-CoA synthetase (AMP-forming)/AMP-acid ligase II